MSSSGIVENLNVFGLVPGGNSRDKIRTGTTGGGTDRIYMALIF
jgi:hypothetical protein